MAFLFNRDSIQFKRMVGEVVLPKGQKIIHRKKLKSPTDQKKETEEQDELQFARSPYLASFQAGWFKFVLCTVHIYFGSSSGLKLERRIKEIQGIAKFFARRQKKETEDYILLGDFNIVDQDHKTMEALENVGFEILAQLRKKESNLKGDKHYDQIALRVQDKQLEIGASGVFRYEKSVFRNSDFKVYSAAMPDKTTQGLDADERRAYYRDKWRTWQISDHMPMWAELKVDFTDEYLKSLKPA